MFCRRSPGDCFHKNSCGWLRQNSLTTSFPEPSFIIFVSNILNVTLTLSVGIDAILIVSLLEEVSSLVIEQLSSSFTITSLKANNYYYILLKNRHKETCKLKTQPPDVFLKILRNSHENTHVGVSF